MSTPNLRRSFNKTINAPPEKVFDSWLIPAVVGRWMFGPSVQNETVIDLVNKVRPRGDYSYRIQRGGKDIECSGEYHVIDRPRKLEFSWRENAGAESLVIVQFDADQSKTRMRVNLQLDPSLDIQADAIREQWSARCSALSDLLAKKS